MQYICSEYNCIKVNLENHEEKPSFQFDLILLSGSFRG